MTEQVSAFLDGEMDRERLDKNVQKLLSDKHAMHTYRDYQRIGEVMRGQEAHSMPNLTSQIMAKIDAEPTVLSPNAIQPPSSTSNESIDRRTKTTTSPAWSIAASVAAVMVVGLFSWQNLPTEQTTIAQADLVSMQPQVPAAKPTNRTATVDAIPSYYLEAHHVSAPSVGSHYIQTVNYSE